MTVNLKPLKPIKQNISKADWSKLRTYRILCWIFTCILTISAITIIAHFISLIITTGFYSEETAKYAMYLVAGSYAFLIIDRMKVKEMIGVKDVSYFDKNIAE